MAAVNLLDIQLVNDNPSYFNTPLRIQIDFECIQELRDDLDWKVVYIGSAESEEHDQVLTSTLVGPIPLGRMIFILEAPPPDQGKIPDKDAIGVTALLLTCSYANQEFVRVGYYVNNDYDTQELHDNPPKKPDYTRITRNILLNKPRVTRLPINWDNTSNSSEPTLYYDPITNGNPIPMSDSNSSMAEAEQVEEIIIPDVQEKVLSKSQELRSFPDFTAHLSKELSRTIFQRLLVGDVAACRIVCKRWRDIIDNDNQGLGWTINLADVEWDFDENSATSFYTFLIKHSSPDLHTLLLPYAQITDSLLQLYLSKCGQATKTLDLSWCSQVNTKDVLEVILQYCPVMENLHLVQVGNDNSIDIDYVSRLCGKYTQTLRGLHVHGLDNQSLQIIASHFPNLRQIGVPFSEVNDEGILSFIQQVAGLEFIGLEFSDVSTKTVQELRAMKPWTIQASHTPDDFIVELDVVDSSQLTYITFGLTGARYYLSEDDISQLGKFVTLPSGLSKDPQDPSRLVFHGDAMRAFADLGFTNVTVKESEEDLEADGLCVVCQKSEGDSDCVECENCESMYHIACLRPPLTQAPEEEWYCENCIEMDQPNKKRKV